MRVNVSYSVELEEVPQEVDKLLEECKLMEKPQHLMFINECKVNNSWVQVFYNGELWTVKKENIYEIEEKE